jgi:hypothetical protein
MGDVDTVAAQAARRRLVGGRIMLATAVVIGVGFWLLDRFAHGLVVLEYPVGWALGLAFAVGSLPLVLSPRVLPLDPRYSRWYVAFVFWIGMIQVVLIAGLPADHQILAESPAGDRSVVAYQPDTPYECLRIWAGEGPAARVAGEIGASPGSNTDARFADRDTVYLTPYWSGSIGPTGRTVRIRLDPKSGRPLDHTGPCVATPSR